MSERSPKAVLLTLFSEQQWWPRLGYDEPYQGEAKNNSFIVHSILVSFFPLFTVCCLSLLILLLILTSSHFIFPPFTFWNFILCPYNFRSKYKCPTMLFPWTCLWPDPDRYCHPCFPLLSWPQCDSLNTWTTFFLCPCHVDSSSCGPLI